MKILENLFLLLSTCISCGTFIYLLSVGNLFKTCIILLISEKRCNVGNKKKNLFSWVTRPDQRVNTLTFVFFQGCPYGDRSTTCNAETCPMYSEYDRTVTCCLTCQTPTTPTAAPTATPTTMAPTLTATTVEQTTHPTTVAPSITTTTVASATTPTTMAPTIITTTVVPTTTTVANYAIFSNIISFNIMCLTLFGSFDLL